MIRKRLIHQPYDFAFKMMYEEFPKELHEELKVPGVFVRKTDVKVLLNYMDASYIVDPDFEIIFERVIVNMEHQSTPVGKPKIYIMTDYEIKNINSENLPNLSVVASHLQIESHEQSISRTSSHILKPYYLDLGSNDNQKRLIKLNQIINNNEKITDNTALNLGIIVLFAPRDRALEITEKVVELYIKIKNKLSEKMEFVLFSVLYAMIDAYCDNQGDFERLINMIEEKTSRNNIDKFESFERVRNNLNSAQHKIVDLETQREIDQQTISDLETKQVLDQQTISDLIAENEKLKIELKKNGNKNV